ncbi:sugar transferase [Parasphingorhabdus sp.]|uniref:sugar transferase n=1 Tax=Parasphingorhabdus sp. TaxID=2709688 RepID=UPI003BAE3251
MNESYPFSGQQLDRGTTERWPLKSVRLSLYFLLQFLDVIAIVAGFLMASFLREDKWLSPQGYHIVLLVVPIFLMFAFTRDSYSIESLKRLSESVRRPFSALFATALVVMMFTFFSQTGTDISRLAFAFAFAASAALLAVGRFVVNQIVWWKLRGIVTDQLLILDGVPPLAFEKGMYCVDAQAEKLYPDPMNPHMLSKLSQVVKGYDRIVVACTRERRSDWALFLKGSDVTGELLVSGANNLGAIGLGDFDGNDTLVVSRGTLSLVNRLKKRAFDLAVTIPLLVFLAPLLIVVAIAIKLDSPGPILFRQPRVGQGNRIFSIYKFRSMRTENGDQNGDQSTQVNDHRITRVGNFIRKTSIDELPQLINVLRNEMSVVGPRPHALGSLAGDKLFWEINQRYWLRHALKPGITGLAQVRGYRGATDRQEDLEARLQSDLEYLEGWRMWRDVTILFQTVKVLIHPNAY